MKQGTVKRKFRREISVRQFMLATLCGIAVLFLLLSTVYIHMSYWNALRSEIEVQEQQTLRFIEDTLSESMRAIEMLARSTANNYTIINSVARYKKNRGNYEQVTFQNNMNRNLSAVAYTIDDIASVNIVMDDPELRTTRLNGVYDYEKYTTPEYVAKLRQTAQGWLPLRKNDLRESRSNIEYIISYTLRIYSGTYFGDTLGNLVINVNENLFLSRLTRFDSQGHSTILVIGKDGQIISSTDRNCIGMMLANTEYGEFLTATDMGTIMRDRKFCTSTHLKDSDMTLLMLTDYSYSMRQLWAVLTRVLFGSGILLIAFLFFSAKASFWISKPILHLSEEVRSFNQEKSTVEIDEASRIQEVRTLQEAFVQMTEEQKRLTSDLIHKEKEKRRIEMEALQAQINPHFLYNTLESVNWMALSRGQKEISEMVIRLGSFLRLSLNRGSDVYYVRDELRQLQDYIYIQNVRSGGKITWREDVADEILDLRMIKLLLQPVVENAILHGFDTRGGSGQIHLTGSDEGEFICFVIEDDGCGMTEEQIADILDTTKDGHGLKNVIRRIQLYYSEGSGLQLSSVPGKGTKAEIRLSKTLME